MNSQSFATQLLVAIGRTSPAFSPSHVQGDSEQTTRPGPEAELPVLRQAGAPEGRAGHESALVDALRKLEHGLENLNRNMEMVGERVAGTQQQAAAPSSAQRDEEAVERRVDDLRAFEREYRSRLKAFLEGQIRDLETGGDDFGPYPTSGVPAPRASDDRERYKAELERQLEQLDRI